MSIKKTPTAKRWNKHSYAHKMVAELQIAMAHEIFDELASRDNKFFYEHNEREFVNAVAPTLRVHARQTLAEMLARNDVSEEDKRSIHTALVLDNGLPNEDLWHLPATVQ